MFGGKFLLFLLKGMAVSAPLLHLSCKNSKTKNAISLKLFHFTISDMIPGAEKIGGTASEGSNRPPAKIFWLSERPRFA